MKKIAALLITFGIFATAFSQSRKIEEAKGIINGDSKQERTVYGENSSRYPGSQKNRGKNKKYKKNNGKHLGWEKGVGNPHRSGNKKNYPHGKGKNKKR